MKMLIYILILIGFFTCNETKISKEQKKEEQKQLFEKRYNEKLSQIFKQRNKENLNPAANNLLNKLELAYKQKNTDNLDKFFLEWNQTIKSNDENLRKQNDTLLAVYEVFNSFYLPLDLLKLGNREWRNMSNSSSKYIAVQNQLFFSIVSSDDIDNFQWDKSKKNSIQDFRPKLKNISNEKILYLTQDYEDALYYFLGDESLKLGEGNIMNPSRPKGDSEKRYNFLHPFLPILHGHWGGWHLNTHPEVSVILLNKDLSKAKILFRVGYQGGYALLEKNGNQWIIKESKATWIE
jgi:hypothetical protein